MNLKERTGPDMYRYDLIAFDMDGTLLTSRQTISPIVMDAINRAIDAGKHVVICTGRGPNELADYIDKEFRRIRYYVTENGGYVYDRQSHQPIAVTPLLPEYVNAVIDAAHGEDAMLVFQGEGQSKGTRRDVYRMDYYHAGRYMDIEKRTAVLFDDMLESHKKSPLQVEKLNVYAATEVIRDRIYDRLRELPVTIVLAEETGFEVTPLGMSKAVGLTQLCDALNIPMERVIAVGDSDNAREMVKAAGLAVAMGNARQCILEISDIVVADNDHDGCAQVINDYLLKE